MQLAKDGLYVSVWVIFGARAGLLVISERGEDVLYPLFICLAVAENAGDFQQNLFLGRIVETLQLTLEIS